MRHRGKAVRGGDAPHQGRIVRLVTRTAHLFMRALVRLYYPCIEVTGKERMPATGPLLFVANHPNSLIDPVIVNMAAGQPVHFLAKAPLFELPVFGPLMQALGMIPAYRGIDNRAQVKRNLESIDRAAALLAGGDRVGLFPEGRSHDLLHVDQVRTGAARIALQAMSTGAEDLRIVPLGITYERKERFRSAVWVDVGAPLELKEWRRQPAETDDKAKSHDPKAPRSEDDERRLTRGLTAEITQRLRATAIHLNDPQWETLLEDVEVLLPQFEEERSTPAGALRLRKTVAEAMNFLLATDPDRAKPLAEAIADLHKRLEDAGLSVNSPVMRYRGFMLAGILSLKTLRLLVGIAPMVAGTIHHLVPFVTVRLVASQFQQPGRMTVALYRMLFGLPVYGAWYALVWWWMARQFRAPGNWVAWAWFAAMPFAGVFALSYWYRAREAAVMWWHQLPALFRRRQLDGLRRDQERVMQQVGELAQEYLRTDKAGASTCPTPAAGHPGTI